MQVTETIKYVGVNDHEIDLFEGQYDVRGKRHGIQQLCYFW